MLWEQAIGLLTNELALDFGSSRTQIWLRGRGLTIDEPTLATIRLSKNQYHLEDIGFDALSMQGKAPVGSSVIAPCLNGSIVQPEIAVELLTRWINRSLGGKPLFKPRIVMAMPHHCTPENKKAYLKMLYTIGSKDSIAIDELFCAAVGCELPIHKPKGSMVVVIGLKSTRVGILSLSSILYSNTIPIGGEHFDAALNDWLKSEHHVELGIRGLEDLKINIGAIANPAPLRTVTISCRDSRAGVPRRINLSSPELVGALQRPMVKLQAGIKSVLQQISPELAGDLLHSGVFVCGGGSKLHGFATYLENAIGMTVNIPTSSSTTVISGAAALLEDPSYLQWLYEEQNP
ncbi:MAG: hypothetical protein CMK59_12755 [Proteobacteria bacterium]|nr:hypothetical protein [Pseudomonadota bacterium]